MSRRYRYPGVQPFTMEDQIIFNGREKDIENLQRKLYLQNLVVLQSKSGYGKSSLINAGIKPLFSNENNYAFISLQFNNLDKTPLQLFYKYLDDLLNEKKLKLEQEYKQLQNSNNDPERQEQIEKGLIYERYLSNIHSVSLWQYFKRLQIFDSVFSKTATQEYVLSAGKDYVSAYKDKTIKYFLVFDQFEKLLFYSEQQRHQVDEFGKELADLYYQKIPSQFSAALHLEKYNDGDIYLNKDFFDFVNANPEWEDYLRIPISICILIGIRIDKLILIDRLSKYLPDLAVNKYELQPLSIDAAHKAILNPAKLNQEENFLSPHFSYQPEAEKKIIKFLTTANLDDDEKSQKQFVEVYQLQMICQHIEEKIIKGIIKPDIINNQIIVNEEDIDDLEEIVRNYYKNELNKFSDNERSIVQYFIEENLILEHEKRRVFIDEGIAKKRLIELGINHSELEIFLEKLTDIRIIRRERSSLDNAYHFELSHDTLISPALNFKKERLLIKQAEEERKKQEELLLSQKQAEEKKFNLLIQARQQAKEEARKRKRLLYLSITITFTLFSVIFVIYHLYTKAEDNAIEANTAKKEIDRLRKKDEKENEDGLYALQEVLKDSVSKLTNYLSIENKNFLKIEAIYDSTENIRINYLNSIKDKDLEIKQLSALVKANEVIIGNQNAKIDQLTKLNNSYKKDLETINSFTETLNKKDSIYRKLQVDYQKSQTSLMKLSMDVNTLKQKNKELTDELDKLKK